MKFATTKEQRDFFLQNNFVEFEEILNEAQIKLLLSEATQVLKSRFKVKRRENIWDFPENVFVSGRDLWRSSAAFKKNSHQQFYAEILAELCQQKIIRMGYDQLFPPCKSMLTQGNYFDVLNKNTSLEAFSCLQGTVGGVILCLEGEVTPQVSTFPSKPGNAVFFNPKATLNFTELLTKPPQIFYLIVYTQDRAVYIHQGQDPLAKQFKDVGYTYGDRLLDKWNPIVYR